MSRLRSSLRAAATRLLRSVPEGVLESAIAARAAALPPAEGLRFLFRLDAALYRLQGAQARAYGGGTHTKHRHVRYHAFFVERIKPGERVLDVGCGRGEVAVALARAGAEVVAVDTSEAKLAGAARHTRVSYRRLDCTRDLPEEAFDVVILSNVLEHLPDRPQLLRRLIEATGAGRFLLRVPLFERDWRVPLKQELGVEWRLDPTHEVEYTLEGFAAELREGGLEASLQRVCWGEIWAECRPRSEDL